MNIRNVCAVHIKIVIKLYRLMFVLFTVVYIYIQVCFIHEYVYAHSTMFIWVDHFLCLYLKYHQCNHTQNRVFVPIILVISMLFFPGSYRHVRVLPCPRMYLHSILLSPSLLYSGEDPVMVDFVGI